MSVCTNVTSASRAFADTIPRARRSSIDGLLREVPFMRELRRLLVLFSAGAFLLVLGAQGQDSPSLGDAARQARLQKQQKDAPPKDAQGKDTQGKAATTKEAQPAKAPHVITNDEIPQHVGPSGTSSSGSQVPGATYQQPAYGNGKAPAEYWTSQIQSVKNYIASLQENIKSLESSIQYAGGNCVANCVQWNERQQQKQQQVENMKAQLEASQKRLEEMQEAARRQGYGSSVYDP